MGGKRVSHTKHLTDTILNVLENENEYENLRKRDRKTKEFANNKGKDQSSEGDSEANLLADPKADAVASLPDKRTDERPIQRPIYRSDGQTDGQTDGQSTGQSKGQSKNLKKDRSKGQTKDRSKGQSSKVIKFTNDPSLLLTHNQASVLYFLIENKSRVTKIEEIKQVTDIPYDTVRKVMRVLVKEGFITKPRKFRKGNYQGIKYSIDDQLCKDFMTKSKGQNNGQSNGRFQDQSNGRTVQWPDKRPGKNLSLEEDNLDTLLLIEQNFNDLYPFLAKIGFEANHIAQIAKCWTMQGLSIKDLPLSLERAEWAVKHNDDHQIEKPLSYVVSSLKRGPFAAPTGFVSRKEQQAAEARKEADKCRELNEQYLEDRFLAWWNGLSQEEKDEVDSINPIVKDLKGDFKIAHRKEYYRENVFVPL
jgi:hypothetical protein